MLRTTYNLIHCMEVSVLACDRVYTNTYVRIRLVGLQSSVIVTLLNYILASATGTATLPAVMHVLLFHAASPFLVLLSLPVIQITSHTHGPTCSGGARTRVLQRLQRIDAQSLPRAPHKRVQRGHACNASALDAIGVTAATAAATTAAALAVSRAGLVAAALPASLSRAIDVLVSRRSTGGVRVGSRKAVASLRAVLVFLVLVLLIPSSILLPAARAIVTPA